MEKLETIFKKWKELLFMGKSKITPLEITRDIPYNEIVSFGAIKGDLINRVDLRGYKGGKDVYLLIYQAPQGSFIKHLHKDVESGIVLIGDSVMKTPTKTVELGEGDVWRLESLEPHTFEFKNLTLFAVLYSPSEPDKDWEATLLE